MSIRILFIIWAILNLFSFAVFILDKFQAKREKSRIPEAVLFLTMLYMGTLGGLIAMIGFRHKIRKWYFWLAIPVLLFSNYLVFEFFNSVIIK